MPPSTELETAVLLISIPLMGGDDDYKNAYQYRASQTLFFLVIYRSYILEFFFGHPPTGRAIRSYVLIMAMLTLGL